MRFTRQFGSKPGGLDGDPAARKFLCVVLAIAKRSLYNLGFRRAVLTAALRWL